jgi:ribosomal protein S27AE
VRGFGELPLQKHVVLLILILVSARTPNKEQKMGILSWLSKRYFGTRSYNDAGFPYEADLCINKCKYAVLGNYNKYYCFVKKHELRRNSTVHGCSYYTIKGEKCNGILCPNCQSDLIERTHDHRFKCAVCGNIFS